MGRFDDIVYGAHRLSVEHEHSGKVKLRIERSTTTHPDITVELDPTDAEHLARLLLAGAMLGRKSGIPAT